MRHAGRSDRRRRSVRHLVSSDQYGYVVPVDRLPGRSTGNSGTKFGPAVESELDCRLGRVSRGWQQVAYEVAAEIRQAVRRSAEAEPSRTVIVNADDLGINHVVNDAIFDLMARSRVTSATLIANGPAIDDAVRGAREFSFVSFGIHLNLAEFEPARPAERARSCSRMRTAAAIGGSYAPRRLRLS